MSFRPLTLLPLLLAPLLAGCASPGPDPDAQRRAYEAEVHKLRRLHEETVAHLTSQLDAGRDDVEALTRAYERRERELQAARESTAAIEQARDAALALLRQKETELATLRGQQNAPGTVEAGAKQLLLQQTQKIRVLQDRIAELEGGATPREPRPDLEGIVTLAHLDLSVPVARVDAAPLTRRDFVEFLYRDLGAPGLLDLFVNRYLLLREAKRQGISTSPMDAELWATQQALAAREAAGSDEKLAGELQRMGFTREAWEARLRYQAQAALALQRLTALQRQTPQGRDAFEARLRAAYEEAYSERVKAKHIFFRVDEGGSLAEDRAAREKAEAVLRELRKDPRRFAELAKQTSEDLKSRELGGMLGTFDRGRFASLPELNTVFFTLEPGRLAGPLRSRLGWHVVAVDERVAPTRPFDAQVRRELTERLEREPPDEAEMQLLIARLRARATIETNLVFEDR